MLKVLQKCLKNPRSLAFPRGLPLALPAIWLALSSSADALALAASPPHEAPTTLEQFESSIEAAHAPLSPGLDPLSSVSLLQEKMLQSLGDKVLLYLPSGPLFRVTARIESRDLWIVVNRRMSTDIYILNLDSLELTETFSKYRTPPEERRLTIEESEYRSVLDKMAQIVEAYLLDVSPEAEALKNFLDYLASSRAHQ